MKFIRPYGQSVTDNAHRKIITNDNKTPTDITEFTHKNTKLILGLYISTLDKIILKPKTDKKTKKIKPCPQNIHDARQKLGDAVWISLEKKLQSIIIEKDEKIETLKDLWNRRIKPYDKIGGESYDPKGKKYDLCVGRNYKWENISKLKNDDEKLLDIVTKIENEINSRLKNISITITKNILKSEKPKYNFTNDDVTTYFSKINVDFANIIFNSLNDKGLFFEKVMPCLQANYVPVFGNINITAVKEKFPELLAIHMKIKDFYKKMVYLKDKKKLEQLLPKNNQKLQSILKNKNDNQNINADIRLGKIIHYQAIKNKTENKPYPTKSEIEKSKYWTSDKQTEIKRNEAFIKSWFNFVAFGSHSLTYLSDSPDLQTHYQDTQIQRQDILVADGLKNALEHFDNNDFSKKLSTMIGQNHSFIDNQELFKFLQKGLADLRNNSFHFKGFDEFIRILSNEISINGQNGTVFFEKCKKLCDDDQKIAHSILKNALNGVKIGEYLREEQIKDYLNKVKTPWAYNTENYAPKFKSVFNRSEAIFKDFIKVPSKEHKKTELFQLQYFLLKMLYQTDFQIWFAENFLTKHKTWITEIKKRADKATVHFKKNNPDIVAKNSKFQDGYKNLKEYCDTLLSLEAREGSIQNGYSADKSKQDTLTDYVNNFKKDMMVFAFIDYINNQKFNYISRLKESDKNKQTLLEDSWFHKTTKNFEPSYNYLYLLFHLVPVGIVSQLRNQLEKYDILNSTKDGENDNKQLIHLCNLYQTTCDAKFEGSGKGISEDVKSNFFELPSDYDIVFQSNDTPTDKQIAQHRHVREMVRFGISNYLKNTKISHQSVINWQKFDEKEIENKYSKIIDLHTNWVNEKNNFKQANQYKTLLHYLTNYREINNHVHLVNHRKLHKLVMHILGRFVGYAFMYERDVYFMTLSYIYKKYNQELIEKPKVTRKYIISEMLKTNIDTCEKRLDKINQNNPKNINILHALGKECPYKLDKANEHKAHPNCIPKNIPENIQSILKNEERRHDFDHFNMLINEKTFKLMSYINNARTLISYDRKLKNAVTKSIKTIFEKENMILSLVVNHNHTLKFDDIKPKHATHLGGLKIKDEKNKLNSISEPLHSTEYLNMVRAIL